MSAEGFISRWIWGESVMDIRDYHCCPGGVLVCVMLRNP
jgi:hypothetical protein